MLCYDVHIPSQSVRGAFEGRVSIFAGLTWMSRFGVIEHTLLIRYRYLSMDTVRANFWVERRHRLFSLLRPSIYSSLSNHITLWLQTSRVRRVRSSAVLQL